ncbi:MAG TPA: hypothetical protein VGJ12_12555 [Gemmatimonadaceae bacterium]|jgi:hypothetical protein
MDPPKLETLAQKLVYSDDGTRWRVREARVHDVPGAEADSCLIFDGGNICRRIWRYPDEWTELSDMTLLAMMDQPR